MSKQWEILEALRHTRHDWLNVMQLIKANLALERYDKIEEIIEEVTNTSVNESKLSMLNVPRVAACLLTYNWRCSAVKVDVDVIGEINSLAEHEEQLFQIGETVINQLVQASSTSSENHLLITFLFTSDSQVHQCQITFDYQGILQMNKEDWTPIIDKLVPEVNVCEFDEHECVLQTTFTLN